MSKKRAREVSDFQVALVEIFEDLANEDEDIRLRAARNLLTNYVPSATSEQLALILRRLFRGLCSGRKSARLGFSIALTEVLTSLRALSENGGRALVDNATIIDILDSQTIPDGQSSGQDERDHYFGRVFGSEAIVKSKILLDDPDDSWKRLVTILCETAVKKPWLRQECGFILYNTVRNDLKGLRLEHCVLDIFHALESHKLVRTPEGVAIWIAAAPYFQRLPKHVWKHEDPLAENDIQLLTKVLMDVPSKPQQENGSLESQGSAVWSTQLHFAWDVVLAELYTAAIHDATALANGHKKKSKRRHVSFEVFWNVVVNDGLCSPTSSTERKHWGLLLFAKCSESCPPSLLSDLFTRNVMSCMINALVEDDRPLKRTAKKALRLIQPRLEHEAALEQPDIVSSITKCLVRLLTSAESGDFDQTTKTKTLEAMMASASKPFIHALQQAFQEAIQLSGTLNSKSADNRTRKMLLQYAKLSNQLCRNVAEGSGDSYHLLQQCASWLLKEGYFVGELTTYSSDIREQIRERAAQCLEQSLKLGTEGVRLINKTITQITRLESSGLTALTPFDEELREVVSKAWLHRQQLLSLANGAHDSEDLTMHHVSGDNSTSANDGKVAHAVYKEGLALMYSLTLLSVYSGEPDAVEMLEDLLTEEKSTEDPSPSKRKKKHVERAADELTVILRNFASRPSKFFRRVSLSIFEAMAPRITLQGLQPFLQVLDCSEDARGLQKLSELDEDGSASEVVDESDVEMDSDVEIASPDVPGSDDEASDTDTEDEGTIEDVSSASDDQDEAQNALEAALASALGTKKVEHDHDSSSSDSDSDMDDEQMMALDDKLAQVFREQQTSSSIKDQQKKDRKDAKETIINLKNRSLDFIDSFFKIEHLSSISLNLVLPLLKCIRTTQTKQVADHAFSVLRDYFKRCSGKSIPTVHLSEKHISDQVPYIMLKEIHDEACMQGSNAHATAASQASILLVKVLVNSGVDASGMVDVYSHTRCLQLNGKMENGEKCYVQPGFFTDWNNWCASYAQT